MRRSVEALTVDQNHPALTSTGPSFGLKWNQEGGHAARGKGVRCSARHPLTGILMTGRSSLFDDPNLVSYAGLAPVLALAAR